MSDKGSVFQTGGGGTNFEQAVQTAFVVTLIIRGSVPCIESGELAEIGLQVKNRGYETDDFLAIVKKATGEHKLLIQVKHDISFTAKNEKFKEVISAFWKDFNNIKIFDKSRDKLIIVKNGLTKDERNHLKSLFNWAVNHATETDFISQVKRIKGKNDQLEVFRKLLEDVSNNTALTDKKIWEFLKCVDVLEYDFLNEGSVDKAYFFNLIKLCKSRNSTENETEIWNSILAFVATLNPNGGSVTLGSIKNESFYKHFDNALLSPYFKAVDKLKSDSKEILRPIKTSIGRGKDEFKLPRTEVREKILDAFCNSQLTIVTGKPGVGKSALIKEVLQKDFPNSSVFVFRADQFNKPSIANVFSSQGVNETIKDIFSCISLIPEKIIFIDSLEKLLEADPECAFKQLLELLKEHPEIKFIASSRKYAIDLITLKFGIDKDGIGIIDIPTLVEKELNIVNEKFPQLNSVLRNTKVKRLLQSPKYLDFSILANRRTNDNYANVTLTEFKDKLWNTLVVDSTNTKNGLPLKREKAFMEIAIKRAKAMQLFVKPDQSDAEAITCLENDGMIFQENDNRKYSPTHDILEDWALVKYVSSMYETYPKPKDLFSVLGNEPAIRRAFRLWVEDYLIDDSYKINELIEETISDQTIEKYWADELLVEVFKSENCSSFFTFFEKELLANNAFLFNRCLHILKTCCKESDEGASNVHIPLPIGSGWTESTIFIQKHISQFEEIRLSILKFLKEWYFRLIFQYNRIEKEELEAVKFIVLHYISEIENEGRFWQGKIAEKEEEILIKILYNLAEISVDEIKQLVGSAITNLENRDLWRLNSFYEKVIQIALSGVGNDPLVKEFPALIILTAWKYWVYLPPAEDKIKSNSSIIFPSHTLRDEECWGIKNGLSFFPSGIYKTPVYNLLWAHPLIGMKFIIGFINYSVEFYVTSSCQYKHKISEIEIELNDGTPRKIWGSLELWTAYRGLSVTNYLLESLLMSLERFLLEIAEIKTEVSKQDVKYISDYVLKNSNNIAPLAVLTSIAIAYPEEIEEAMLPLFSVREFYEWDSERALKEATAHSIKDNEISFAQKERWNSNRLPHRTKYSCGMRDFILDYQFNIKKLNPQIHNIIDKLNRKSKKKDIFWKKLLNEIDIRKWFVRPYDKKISGFVAQPKYDVEITKHLESTKKNYQKDIIQHNYSEIISKAHQNPGTIGFEKWVECYNYYSRKKKLNFIFTRPVTLAVLGLNEFSNLISKNQKSWCIKTLFESIFTILQDTRFSSHSIDIPYNVLEKDIALSSFHLLMQHVEDETDKNKILVLIIYMLNVPFADFEIEAITKYIREIFFKHFPNDAKRVWLALIKYSIYTKSNQNNFDYFDTKKLKNAIEKEKEFVIKIASDLNLKFELSEISLEKCEAILLARALLITPFNTMDQDFSDFINHLLPVILADLVKEEKFSNNTSSEFRQFPYETTFAIKKYLAKLLLNANLDFSKFILTKLVGSLSSSVQNQRYGRNDLLDFVNTILDYFVLYLYDNGKLKIDPMQYAHQRSNFWSLWEVLCNLLPANENHPLKEKFLLKIRYLLWDSDWKPNENDWSVLNGRKEFYKKMLLEKGKEAVSSAIDVFSTIGGKEFLPEGISWLTTIFRSDYETSECLASVSSERMIKRLYYNYISKIKSDKTLMDDYLWILNRMVDLGSSEAYLFRENVIVYKTNGS